ncbi:putative arabinose efflux permease, MFS family [Fodinibius salinus]|uniref:Putative arabinose efflux permease, MFS family n=1 Tax=Fodinibius salinus TaxID=860790 RepID=A0A5D3YLY1_9BACT|nr:MFS transporter [Fodinibius salinus]TYP94847.1 putative arabinose efflux permease, MFS family [Fodinibius salinus]
MLENIRPYIDLVSNNRDYRRLWLSQIVSNFGDWFGILAVYALITRYSDSEFLLGLIIVVKMLSLASFSPFAGYLTDRFDRRRIMIACDLLRGLLVACLLLVVSYETLWLAYVLTALQMMLSAVFEPAKTSSIPNVTTKEELVDANVLSSASWSIIFTMGMGFGGLATAWLGTDLVFIIDALSYGLSAWFIYGAVIPQEKMSEKELHRTRNPLVGIKEGFQYLRDNPQVLRPTLAKACFTMFLGALTYMLILVSEEVLLMGSVGLGLLYASRGVGTGIGPIIGRRIFKQESGWIRAMGFCMMFGGLMYAVVGWTTSLVVMLVFVFIAHAASGANWVMSTVLLQRRTPDTFRGRIFSTEWLLFTVAQSISVMAASWILENGWLTIQQTMIIFSMLLSLAGVFWHQTLTQDEDHYQEGVEDLTTAGTVDHA